MKNRFRLVLYRFLRTLPLGLVAAATPVVVAEVRAEVKTPEEWACEAALKKNTIEALEEFLARYPDPNSACGALALEALNGFDRTADAGSGGNGPGGGNGSSYGGL